MTEPGRLLSLGVTVDRRDARGLLDVARGCARMRQHRLAGTTHVANQALWSFWELPRMGPRVAGKYPKAWPWSPDARGRYHATAGRKPAGGWGLVYEHVRPRALIVADLIANARHLTVDDVVERLHSTLAGAVITRTEDQALLAAGVAKGGGDPHDPDVWVRYRIAGLDPQTYKPLESPAS